MKLLEGQRYERNGLFAIPETIDDLTDQLNSPEQWVAYGLTHNFLATEFNKALDNIQIEVDKLERKCRVARESYDTLAKFMDERKKELDRKYVFDSVSDMIKYVKELEQGNANI